MKGDSKQFTAKKNLVNMKENCNGRNEIENSIRYMKNNKMAKVVSYQ